MGYYANGSGSVVLKESVDKESVLKLLEDLETDIEFELCCDGIGFWENDSHWHEEDTFEFLETLTPYIKEGCANYTGEEDCIWRYKFYPESETWKEEYATVDYNFESYTDEELIAELTKRGYKVTK